MNAAKTTFSIKDLENLVGVKAHTIRIWEKRYKLLEPERTPTNIRLYTLKDLQKLLNVAYLLKHGHKISKIAKNDSDAIATWVGKLVSDRKKPENYQAINSFKISMMNFDSQLFATTFERLEQEYSFKDIFCQVFIPLLEEIGLLWQTNTIDPSHEHFIANLIKQKILIKVEEHQLQHAPQHSTTFVLFLPENEIHDLGLLFLNYEIVSHGFKCIYLGQSIMLENLKYLMLNHKNINFAAYLTVKPDTQTVAEYANQFNQELSSSEIPFYIFGRKAETAEKEGLPKNVRLMKSIDNFIAQIA